MNLQQYFTAAMFTELSYDPVLWVAAVFTVVAAASAVARREHVGGDGSWAAWASQRNEVIHRQRVKQTSGATTVGAAAAKVVKGKLPIRFCEVVWQAQPEGGAAAGMDAQLVAVGLLPLSPFLWIVWLQPFLNTVVFTEGFRVFIPPLPMCFVGILAVGFGILAGTQLVAFNVNRLPISLDRAWLAGGAKATSIVSTKVEILASGWVIGVTDGAMLEGVHISNYTIFEAA